MDTESREAYILTRPPIVDNEAARFVEENLKATNQNMSLVYSPPLDEFVSVEVGQSEQQVSKDMFQAANDELRNLFALMEKVQLRIQKRSKGKYVAKSLKFCSWKHVLSEVELTSDQWKMISGNTKRKNCLRAVGSNSDTLQAWIGLLPSGDYGAGICGVFSLAIGAASRYLEVEEAIFDALTEFPELMEDAKDYVDIYRRTKDHRLVRKTFDLYLAILRALTQIMLFFAESSTKKSFGVLFAQTSFKENLTNALDEVRRQSSKIQIEASKCLAIRQAKMDDNVMIIQDLTSNMDRKLDQMSIDMLSMQQSQQRVGQTFYRTFWSNLMAAVDQNRLLELPTSDTFRNSSPALSTTSLQDLFQRNEFQLHKKSEKNSSKLLSLLNFDMAVIEREETAALDEGYMLNPVDAARASIMINHDAFREWLSGPQSSALLVNGNTDLAANEGSSPFSLVCAQLSVTMDLDSQAFVVRWFGDNHQHPQAYTDSKDLIDIPREMLASLIGQLVWQLRRRNLVVDFSFMKKADWHHVADFTLNSLTRTFRELVAQLPASSIFTIIIDEIDQYEVGETSNNIFTILRRLLRTVHEVGKMIKLIATCRGKSTSIRELFAEGNVLEMPQDVEGDDGALWLVRNMERPRRRT